MIDVAPSREGWDEPAVDGGALDALVPDSPKQSYDMHRVIGGIVHGIFWTVVGAYAAYNFFPNLQRCLVHFLRDLRLERAGIDPRDHLAGGDDVVEVDLHRLQRARHLRAYLHGRGRAERAGSRDGGANLAAREEAREKLADTEEYKQKLEFARKKLLMSALLNKVGRAAMPAREMTFGNITPGRPAEAARRGLSARIGCHSDELWHLAAWKRVVDFVHAASPATGPRRSWP